MDEKQWASAGAYLTDMIKRTHTALTVEEIPKERVAQYLRDLADDVLGFQQDGRRDAP